MKILLALLLFPIMVGYWIVVAQEVRAYFERRYALKNGLWTASLSLFTTTPVFMWFVVVAGLFFTGIIVGIIVQLCMAL